MEKWILYAIVSMVFAGVTSVIAKFGMKDLSSDVALALRTTVVFVIITANGLFFQNNLAQIRQASLSSVAFLCLSGLTTSLSWIFYYRAMKEGSVSYVASIDKASILVTLVLSFFILDEPLTPKLLFGAGFILVGMLILVWR